MKVVMNSAVSRYVHKSAISMLLLLQGSNDSGKGGSDVATPPSSRTPAGDGSVTDDVTVVPIVYEFVIPQQLVGRLIGRFGCFVAEIKEKTHAHILIKKHPTNNKLKVCAIEGNLKKKFNFNIKYTICQVQNE